MTAIQTKISTIFANDEARSNCKHPINDTGRINVAMRDGEPRVECIYGLPDEYRPNYEYPKISTGIMHLWDMVGAVKSGDMVTAQVCAQRYTETPIVVEIPYGGKDSQKRDVSTQEKCFFDSFNIIALAEAENMSVSLLNPSTGTISRLKKMSTYLPISIVDGSEYEKYSYDLQNRMDDEGYVASVDTYTSYADLPMRDKVGKTILYYCGMRADKAYLHKVPNIVGFALDPYCFTVKGNVFTTYDEREINGEAAVYCEYLRDNYTTTLYHFLTPRCHTYAFDSVHKLFSNSKYANNRVLSEQWRIMSTLHLPVPILSINVMVPPSVEVLRFRCSNITLKNRTIDGVPYEVYYGEQVLEGEKISLAFDIKSPEVLSRRRQLLMRSQLRLMFPTQTKDYNVELYPFLSHPVELKFREVVVKKSASKTQVTSYVCDVVRNVPAEILFAGDRVVVPKHIPFIQPVKTVAVKTNNLVFMVQTGSVFHALPNLKKRNDHYDFKNKQGLTLGGKRAQNNRHIEILQSLGRFSDPRQMEIQGYYPEYGDVDDKIEYWGNGQAYVTASIDDDDTVVLFQSPNGNIVGKGGAKYEIHVTKTHLPVISLRQLCMRDVTLNRNQYMMLCGGHMVMGKYALLDNVTDDSDINNYEMYEDF